MNAAARPVSAGKTRVCPHCKAVVLESLSVCPGCRHHLRFDAEAAQRQEAAIRAFEVDGEIAHPAGEDPCEYSIVVTVRNAQGQQIARQLVAVGALCGGEHCSVALAVEVLPTRLAEPPVPAGAPVTLAVVPEPAAPATGGRRLPDGTVLMPPGMKPRR
jgi:uncharacterized protein YbaR (Trm112 family)